MRTGSACAQRSTQGQSAGIAEIAGRRSRRQQELARPSSTPSSQVGSTRGNAEAQRRQRPQAEGQVNLDTRVRKNAHDLPCALHPPSSACFASSAPLRSLWSDLHLRTSLECAQPASKAPKRASGHGPREHTPCRDTPAEHTPRRAHAPPICSLRSLRSLRSASALISGSTRPAEHHALRSASALIAGAERLSVRRSGG